MGFFINNQGVYQFTPIESINEEEFHHQFTTSFFSYSRSR